MSQVCESCGTCSLCGEPVGLCEGSAQHIARILHTATADPHATALAVHDSSGRGGSPAARYWQLNSVGAFVLRGLLDGTALEEVAKTLAARYALSQERAGNDVTALVESLRAARLVST